MTRISHSHVSDYYVKYYNNSNNRKDILSNVQFVFFYFLVAYGYK